MQTFAYKGMLKPGSTTSSSDGASDGTELTLYGVLGTAPGSHQSQSQVQNASPGR